MKCYYEVLGIGREVDSSEIKSAYRKLALKWHPDKNLTNPEEAKEQFQTVQNAYEVLSDPQERAWYDSHREQLLRGAGTSFNDNSVDLIPFFTPSCYKGFGDDEKSFYSIYREVFHKLAAEEVDYLDDPEDVSSIPMFGKSDTEYESVHEFYAYWMSFSTSKSYVWLDKYDIREADNRRVLKMIEKENNKIRQKARKERNDEIRNLISFVRRRDKRVAAHSKLLLEKAEENKKKAEQIRKDKLVLRQKELEEAKKKQSDNKVYAMSDFHEQLDQIEKNLAEEFGHSDEETLTGPSDDEEDQSNDVQENDANSTTNCAEEQSSKGKTYRGSQNLYCTACSKFFKTIKSFQNHENSKKHKENVLSMKLETDLGFSDDAKSNGAEEDSDIAVSSSKNIPDSDELKDDVSDDEVQVQSKKKKKKNKKKPKLLESNESDIEDEINLENLNSETRNRRGRKIKTADKTAAKKKSLQKEKSEDKESVDDTDKKDGDENSKSSEGLTSLNGDISAPLTNDASESVSKKSLTKKKVSNKNKEKKLSQKDKELLVNSIDITDIDTSHCCAICKNEFNSKNKLFDHLKKTGHQIYLPQSQASTAKPSKKKGTKK